MPRSGGTSNLSMSHLLATDSTLRSRPHHHQTLPSLRERAPKIFVEGTAPGETRMSRNYARVLALAFGGLILPAQAFAQLTPPAGSAGAGNSPISGIPFGPANPRVLSDPSGIGNAALVPPLRANPPPPPVSYGSVNSSPPSPTRVLAPPYAGASQRIMSPHDVEPRSKTRGRRRGRAQVSTFTGICRGC
jgi:hypothetical protein